jgi:hypothetical protein
VIRIVHRGDGAACRPLTLSPYPLRISLHTPVSRSSPHRRRRLGQSGSCRPVGLGPRQRGALQRMIQTPRHAVARTDVDSVNYASSRSDAVTLSRESFDEPRGVQGRPTEN